MMAFSTCALPKVSGHTILAMRAIDRDVPRVEHSSSSYVAHLLGGGQRALQRGPPKPAL